MILRVVDVLISSVAISAVLLVHCGEENNFSESEEFDEDDNSIFVPTKEWQEVKKGQSIPAGLHIRLNLQTGERQAKLMDDGEGKEAIVSEDNLGTLDNHRGTESSESSPYGTSDRRGVVNKRTKVFGADDVQDMLHNLNNNGESGRVHRIASSSSVPSPHSDMKLSKDNQDDYITKESVKLPISFHRDVEVMMNLSRVLADNSSSVAELCGALEELEYYVHQIDNARDLNVIGGLVLVVRLLNHTHPEVRTWAAHVLGSASQSNPAVQRHAMEYDSLRLLSALVADTEPDLVQRRALFALSALLRGNVLEQINFIKNHHGLKVLGRTFKKRSASVQLKAVVLLTDFLNAELVRNVTNSDGLHLELPILVYNSVLNFEWCDNVPTLIRSHQLVWIEKGLLAMELLVRTCGFTKEVQQLQELAKKLERDSSSSSDDSEYFLQLLEHCRSLLRSIREYNSEL